MKLKTICTMLAATAALASPAFGSGGAMEGRAAYAIGIEGYVPVICRVSVGAAQAPAEGGLTPLGAMTEFCNAAQGYQVWVDHAPGLDGAAIHVDGQRVALSAGGSTLLSGAGHAALRTRALSFEAGEDAAPGSLSLRIVPASA